MAADKLLIRDNMKSAIRSPNLEIWPLVRFWLIKRPLRPLAFQDPSAFIARNLVSGSPSGHPRAKTTEASARLWPSPGKLFREAGPAPSARTMERTRATARVCHGCRGSFGRRPENCFGKQRASSQRQNYGSERERRAPPRLDKTATAAGRP